MADDEKQRPLSDKEIKSLRRLATYADDLSDFASNRRHWAWLRKVVKHSFIGIGASAVTFGILWQFIVDTWRFLAKVVAAIASAMPGGGS